MSCRIYLVNEKVLEVKNLSKHFGKVKAVDDISFYVKKGEIVGLLGPNGAGKTTTITMLLGITLPTGGKIETFGKDFFKYKKESLARMNYSSAYAKLPWRLKAWESLYVFSQLYGVENPKAKIKSLLEVFDVTQHKDTLMGDLSAGNTTRINLCKAFINDPELVLLDEPTASLDPDVADRVRNFIKKTRENFSTTILITSHNMAEIEELCDRVIFINKGKIVAEDTPEGLAKKIRKSRVKFMMRDGMKRTISYCKKHRLKSQVNERFIVVEVDEKGVAKLLNDLAALEVDYKEISIAKPTLSDYFITEARSEK